MQTQTYRIYLKYSNTSAPIHTWPKIRTNRYVSKVLGGVISRARLLRVVTVRLRLHVFNFDDDYFTKQLWHTEWSCQCRQIMTRPLSVFQIAWRSGIRCKHRSDYSVCIRVLGIAKNRLDLIRLLSLSQCV